MVNSAASTIPVPKLLEDRNASSRHRPLPRDAVVLAEKARDGVVVARRKGVVDGGGLLEKVRLLWKRLGRGFLQPMPMNCFHALSVAFPRPRRFMSAGLRKSLPLYPFQP